MPDKTKLNYHVKPLDKIISLGLKKKIEEKIDQIDISWCADHGGGFSVQLSNVLQQLTQKHYHFHTALVKCCTNLILFTAE